MKKIYISIALFSIFGLSTVANAQEKTKSKTESRPAHVSAVETKVDENSIYSPLKPEKGSPYVFSSQADLDAAKGKKIAAVKEQISVNSSNPEKVKQLREELWRLENAIVKK